MIVQTAEKVDDRIWDEFVLRHPFGSIYHHSSWQAVITETYGFKPIYHLIRDDSSNLSAAAVSAYVESRFTGNRIISFPFSDTCDLLVNDSHEADALMRAMETTRSDLGADFIEYRFVNAQRFLNGHDWDCGYGTHCLSLRQDRDLLLRSFHRSCIQRGIKTARRREIQVYHGSSLEDLRSFYRIHLLTRKKLGVPVQPFRFFKNLWSTLRPRGMLTLLLARHEQNVIAGIIVLWFKNIAHYKFGASDDRFLRLRANQLLMWEGIRLAHAKDCTTFDFGRTDLANESLFLYKQRWGAEGVPLFYARVPKDTKLKIFKESSRSHSRLKGMVSRMPIAFIRLSGELFYRHFA